MIEIINKKRLGEPLTKEELQFVVSGYVDGGIPDYQMASLLMAITINGMNEEESINLTEIMLNSGDKIDLSKIKGIKVDKHSTGGVGDKTTLILAPLVAALGVPVAKMSGRGLGLTGGTIDKLEAIDGFQTAISNEDFVNQVNEVGCCIATSTGNLVPADKKIYALRDVTATVSSIPLIASSIMSKKLASGADKIVIDLKVGHGAFMSNLEDARTLAKLMCKIGNSHNKETICILTNMNQPLGTMVGNGLEVQEAIDVLLGKGPNDLKELVIELASYMLVLGKGIKHEEAKPLVIECLENKKAYEKWEEMVLRQKGNINNISISEKNVVVKSVENGYVHQVNAEKIGIIAHKLGAGRTSKEDKLDFGVGIELHKKVGDSVQIGEVLATVYFNEKDITLREVLSAFVINKEEVKIEPLIYEVIK